MNHTYAQALIRLEKDGMDAGTLVTNLRTHLALRGREKLLPGILRALKELRARDASRGSILEVAREEDTNAAKKSAHAAGVPTDDIRINPSLIRGWRARNGSTLIDQSAKRTLIELYERIVKE